MADWAQIGHDGPHLLHLFPGDCMFETAETLAVAGLLAVVEFPVTEVIGWEIDIFHTGSFLDLDRSNPIIFCFAGAGLYSLLPGIGHDLVTNKFTDAGKVEGHGVVALGGLDIIDGVVDVVVTAVVGIRVPDTVGSTRGFSTTLTLYCLLFACCAFLFFFLPLRDYFWRLVLSGMMAYGAFQARWTGARLGQLLDSLVPSRSSSF